MTFNCSSESRQINRTFSINYSVEVFAFSKYGTCTTLHIQNWVSYSTKLNAITASIFVRLDSHIELWKNWGILESRKAEKVSRWISIRRNWGWRKTDPQWNVSGTWAIGSFVVESSQSCWCITGFWCRLNRPGSRGAIFSVSCSTSLYYRRLDCKQIHFGLVFAFYNPKSKIAMLEEIKCLQRATNKDLFYTGSFHEAIAPVLVLAQLFALMPVIGIKGDTASDLRFSWKAFRTAYSLIVFVLTTIYAALAIFMAFRRKVEFDLVG